MTDDALVTGPHRVDHPHPGLVDALAELWGRVAVAGGAVGFGPTDPVEELRSAASTVVDQVTARRAFLLTLGRDHVLVGMAVLTPARLPVRQHTGELTWLMVDPRVQGQGWGSQLHDAALSQAEALGLAKLELSTRSDRALERFYTERGWIERGRWPGAVRIGDREWDRLWFTRDV